MIILCYSVLKSAVSDCMCIIASLVQTVKSVTAYEKIAS